MRTTPALVIFALVASSRVAMFGGQTEPTPPVEKDTASPLRRRMVESWREKIGPWRPAPAPANNIAPPPDYAAQIFLSPAGRAAHPLTDVELATTSAASPLVMKTFVVTDDRFRRMDELHAKIGHPAPESTPVEKWVHTVVGPNVYFFDRKKHFALVRVGPLVFFNFNW